MDTFVRHCSCRKGVSRWRFIDVEIRPPARPGVQPGCRPGL